MPTPSSILAGIVTYNTALNVLEQTLLSFQNADIQVDLVVLCNSPFPDYRDSVKALAEKYGATVIISEKNFGFGFGHNQIFDAYKPDWYFCSNPDLSFMPATLSIMIEAYRDLGDAVLVGPVITDPGNPIPPSSRNHISVRSLLKRYLLPSRDNAESQPFHMPSGLVFPVEFVSGCFFLISGERFRQLHGFDSNFFLYCEDADLSLRASQLGQNYVVARAAVYHPSARATFKNWRMFSIHVTSMARFLLKHAFTPRNPRRYPKG